MKPIAFFGTGSDVGKSIVAAAACRSLAARGVRVAPFKAQNMSNNSGITPEGLEMGRAQIVQAEAAGIVPHVDMNPVLLKPTGEKGSQVVLLGEARENSTAVEYHQRKSVYFETACRAYDRLSKNFEQIVLEGAGSCAEVNLMASDIVNFPMAEYAGAHVVLVADIHRGGVFAQVVGTLACLPDHYRQMIKGVIINRFRGDIALFKDGVEWIEDQTGVPVLGVLPWYHHFRVDAEDSVELETACHHTPLKPGVPAVAVIRLKHISNFTDFHALMETPGLQVRFLDRPRDLSDFAGVILPGSKNTRSDLSWLSASDWDRRLLDYHAGGGHILGICGGFQILGVAVEDPDGVEDRPGNSPGLGLLPVMTTLKSPKTTTITRFSWGDIFAEGYEIHMGHTRQTGGQPLLTVERRNSCPCRDHDGVIRDDGRVMGTYMHGWFDAGPVKYRWLEQIGVQLDVPPEERRMDGARRRQHSYEMLREHFEAHVDMERIYQL